MKRSKSESNIEVTSLIDKDQNSWKFNSESTVGNNFNPTNVIEWMKASEVPSLVSERIKMDHSTNQTNILRLQMQQIANQILQLQLHLTTLTQLDSDSDEVITHTTSIQRELDSLTKQKNAIEQEINQSVEISNVFTNKIDIPEFSNADKQLNWKMIYNAIPQKIDGANKQEFKSAWQIIRNIATTQKWSENNLEEALNFVLIAEPQDMLMQQHDLPFQQRLRNVLTIYLPTDNLHSRQKDLRQFKRYRGDNLDAVMTRLEYYIDRTNVAYPKGSRQGRKETIMENTLLKVCSPAARAKLESRINDSFNQGFFLSIQEKIAIACKEEAICQDIPQEDISIALNESTTVKQNTYAFNIEARESSDADLNSVSSYVRSRGRSEVRRPNSRGAYDRDQRRREMSEKRSTSRDDTFTRMRTISSEPPTVTYDKKVVVFNSKKIS